MEEYFLVGMEESPHPTVLVLEHCDKVMISVKDRIFMVVVIIK